MSAKTEAAYIRMSKDELRCVKQAAKMEGKKWTAWMREKSLAIAKSVVEEHNKFMLVGEDRDLFLDALDNPPSPGKNLKKAVDRYLKKYKSI